MFLSIIVVDFIYLFNGTSSDLQLGTKFCIIFGIFKYVSFGYTFLKLYAIELIVSKSIERHIIRCPYELSLSGNVGRSPTTHFIDDVRIG